MKKKKKLGFVLTGSFCTFKKAFALMEELSEDYEIIPVMSFNASKINSRFGTAEEHINKILGITGRKPIITIEDAEPVGPKNMTDLMLVCPCTGNTLAKLANSITDTPATMAVKSHLRNQKPVIVALATNDGISGTMKNIATLINAKNYYFVPAIQDDIVNKPTSLVANISQVKETILAAEKGVAFSGILFNSQIKE
jgi:dipicolinate synthase subunit B